MPNRLKKEAAPEIIDPQLEFARQARPQDGHQRDEDQLLGDPPQAVDRDFCYSEETKK